MKKIYYTMSKLLQLKKNMSTFSLLAGGVISMYLSNCMNNHSLRSVRTEEIEKIEGVKVARPFCQEARINYFLKKEKIQKLRNEVAEKTKASEEKRFEADKVAAEKRIQEFRTKLVAIREKIEKVKAASLFFKAELIDDRIKKESVTKDKIQETLGNITKEVTEAKEKIQKLRNEIAEKNKSIRRKSNRRKKIRGR